MINYQSTEKLWFKKEKPYFFFILDRNQFDNPVYSYQGNSRNDDGTDTLLNNVHIRNVLSRKNINSERAKLGFGCCTDDDEDSCKGIRKV